MSGPPGPGVRIDRDLVIPLADGTRLAADLYRPAPPGPVPVLVSYYPYRKDDIIGSLFEGTRIRLCERGYATVFADMTGTGASEGDYGESFDLAREGRDAAAIVEWVAGQDWCDGQVGAWGVSYGGMTALAAAALPAAQRPASLRAIIAVYATTDIYRDTIAPGGCPAMLGRYAWAAHMMALGLCPPTRPDPGGRWRRTWARRLRRLAGAPSHAVTWQAHPDRDDAYWRSRVLDATAIDVPVMLIGGWADMFKDAMTSLYGAVTGPKRLVMGPWMHVLPHLSGVEPYDWAGQMADWWDEHLRRVPSPPRDPVLFFARGAGWRSAARWPPEGAGTRRLFLAGHGLEPAPPASPGQREYHGDAGVGVASGMWDPFGTGNGWPEEQSGDDARSLTFTSEPLPGPVLIAGRPEAGLYLAAAAGPAPGAHLAVRLAMVGPDGRSTLITTGWYRLAPGGPVPGGPVLDGTERVAITLGAAAFAVPAGARLRLSVACADFPRIWPSSENPAIRLCFGADRPSELRIPVCDHDVAPASIPAPPAVPDPGWVIGGEPRYHVAHDKAAGDVAVTFGARSRLRPPSGAEMSLDERFTARVRPGRPAGAALTAQVDIGLRLPGGERAEVTVRSTSSRTTSLTQGRVTLDGTLLFEHTWTNADS